MMQVPIAGRFRSFLCTYMRLYAVALVTLAGLYVVMDAFGSLDEHFAAADRRAIGLVDFLGQYYLHRMHDIGLAICGATGLLAAVLTFVRMKSRCVKNV